MRMLLRSFGIMILAALIPLTTSAGARATINPYQSDLESLGTAPGNAKESNPLTAEVHQAKRDSSGVLLSVAWSIENTGDDQVSMLWLRDRSYSYSGQNFAGVTAVSPDGVFRYHPIMDGNGTCLCSGSASNDLVQNLASGAKVTYWSMYSVPEDLESITIEIPNFEPIEDIPIS
ncbi:hypothetical protein [Nocardiopsis quinghaiensis]|uniref:hypothetical protein n=1 Tax=Nocardiopsis quinghaiensis TaxID=464995 RepID=UPI001CC2648B|nr:hypothetical protein [Nocardiopsis quinghaiensis]